MPPRNLGRMSSTSMGNPQFCSIVQSHGPSASPFSVISEIVSPTEVAGTAIPLYRRSVVIKFSLHD